MTGMNLVEIVLWNLFQQSTQKVSEDINILSAVNSCKINEINVVVHRIQILKRRFTL